MKHTPFYNVHKENNAKFVDYAGWELPIHFGSIIEEHNHTRNGASFFDVSHMGRIEISGRHARRFLEKILTRSVTDMKEETCRYTLICNENGGVKDDALVYKFDDHWLLVVNAANREKILAHFDEHKTDMVVDIKDKTESTAMVAVQGPKVMEVVANFSKEIPTLKPYNFRIKNLMILKMTISRTGYTGEDGVEIILPAKMATMPLKFLTKGSGDSTATIKPAGLGARDTLRTEAAMPLYGHELDEQTDPLSAGLNFAVNLDKQESEDGFVGQKALNKINESGISKQLIGLKLEGRRAARQGAQICTGDKEVGTVTSGCLSPTLGYPIAMAYVEAGRLSVGDSVNVTVGAKQAEAEVVKLPFYKRAL